MKNLFESLGEPGSPEEWVDVLAAAGDVRVERIVSQGHASPEGFWYDQQEHEFVAVLQGAARLRFEAPDEIVELKPGDHLTIRARRRHRVEWTTPDGPTIWLAVFFPAVA